MSGHTIRVHHRINVSDVLERAGADAQAPEGSQAWALAQIAIAADELVEALRNSPCFCEDEDSDDSAIVCDRCRVLINTGVTP